MHETSRGTSWYFRPDIEGRGRVLGNHPWLLVLTVITLPRQVVQGAAATDAVAQTAESWVISDHSTKPLVREGGSMAQSSRD